MSDHPDVIARQCAEIAVQAGLPVMEIYQRDFASWDKSDGSPLTEADLAADRIIVDRLQMTWPHIPIITEERQVDTTKKLDRFFLVDPLDGTREFLNRTGEFTINIALIENGQVIAGAVYAPVIRRLYLGGAHAYRYTEIEAGSACDMKNLEPIRIRQAAPHHLVVLASLSHGDPQTDKLIQAIPNVDVRKSGSSLKFCIIAEGGADFYPRFGRTMGWDIAAGHAVLRAAGGNVLNATGKPQIYSSTLLANGPFIAIGDHALEQDLTNRFRQLSEAAPHAKTGIAG